MTKRTAGIVAFCLTAVLFPVAIHAATVTGNAFKSDQTLHDGITVTLQTPRDVPAIGIAGLVLTACVIGLFLMRRQIPGRSLPALLLLSVSCSFVCYATLTYTAQTQISGVWQMEGVMPGEYHLEASAPGYQTEMIHPLTIVDGVNPIGDITLYPQTPTPVTAIVIDHAAVDLYDQIPATYMDQIKTMWLNLPGESHASGYRKGLTFLQDQEPAYAVVVTESGTPEPYRTDALRISGLNRNQYNNWATGAGEAKWYADPAQRDLLKNHLTYCNTHDLVIAAMGFGWCWDMTWHNGPGGTMDPVFEVRWAGSSEGGPEGDLRWGLDAGDFALTGNTVCMDTYLDATQEYIDYCVTNGYSTQVIFTTGPVDGYSGESGYQRHIKHEYIRNYVQSHSMILFDYADILSYSDAGDQNLQTWNTHSYQMIHPDNMDDFGGGYTEDGDHIGQVGALRLGKALWVLMARIAGWEGP